MPANWENSVVATELKKIRFHSNPKERQCQRMFRLRMIAVISYASKFGILSSGHRTGKGQFSFQSQRMAMLKDVQTTLQLHSCHMLARLCSKSFKLGISSTWTKNFQMYKMDSEEAAEPVIKLPTFFGSSRNQRSSRNTSTSASLTTLKPLTMWITTNCGKFF